MEARTRRSFFGLLVLLTLAGPILPAADVGFAESPSAPGLWAWPAEGPVAVLRPFDPPAKPWMSGHRGVDLNVAVGAVVSSPAAGTVIHAGVVVDRPTVSIMHAGGLRSTYEPVEPLVGVGQKVVTGTPVGTLVESGSGDHQGLHWGARFEKNQYIDPLRLLVGPSILKPWD